jgi:hypothetical protein
MPPLSAAINADRSNLTPVDSAAQENKPVPPNQKVTSLLRSPYQMCPLPASNNAADSLRQWGQGSDIPRFRTQTPPSNIGGSGGTTVNKVGEVIAGGAGSSSSSTTISPAQTAQTVTIITPALVPDQIWTGSVQMAKGFLLLRVTANSFCRIELYGTAIAQTLDLGRTVEQGPPNTTQGLILDVVLLTSLSWQVLDCVGANGDSPQTSTIYVTITNLSTAVRAFTVTMQFVEAES